MINNISAVFFKSQKHLNITVPTDFTVTAHTGAMKTPQNSVESVVKSIETGADIFEVDVTFRKDGKAVIIHSDSPRDDEGILFEEIAKKLCQNERVRVNLDLKAFWNTAEIQRILSEYDVLDRAFYTGVFSDNAEQVKNGSPLIPYFINCAPDITKSTSDDYINSLACEIKQLGGIGINSNYIYLNKKITDIMHDNGLLVSAWTVDSRKDQIKMLSYGVDNITTKRPDKLIELIKSVNE